ncbi:MAG: DUF3987 domain-containing protein [Pseudonocardiaceae bacterium]
MSSPYADTYLIYRKLGWLGTLPVPARQKTPPPDGFTGWDGHYPSGADAHAFTEEPRWSGANLILRMPPTVVGIDIDAYLPKTGAATLAEGQCRWGSLPAGPWSSARDDGVSGIRFFRVPDGTVLRTVIGFPELGIGHIDVIQRHHRYAVVWPSIHPTGAVYTWRGADGDVLDQPLSPDDLPPLPEVWLRALAGTGTAAERACPEQVTAFLSGLPAGDPCTTVVNQFNKTAAALEAPVKARHDDTCENVLRLLRLGEQGHPGVPATLAALREVFIREVIVDGSRTRASAEAEFDRMREGERGVGLIQATPTAPADRGCRCAPTGSVDSVDIVVTSAWPDPVPLDPPRTPAVFPVDALPDWAADYVAALSEATQTPPDLAGCCVLGVFAACAGGRAVVEARRGWQEPVNLYLLPVLRPGSRKSAVISAATRPLYDAEKTLWERARSEIAETATLRDIAVKAAEKATRDAANAKPDKRDELSAKAVSAASQAAAIQVPIVPRLIADDVTPEAAASLLADHGGRLAIISAEGGIFDIIAGKYNNSVPCLDVWLKGHAGDPLHIDRKGRDSEYIEHPALTMLLTVQPSVLSTIASNAAFRGRGLLARFLYSIPKSNLGHRRIGAEPVSDDITSTHEEHVRKLFADLADWTDPTVLTLSPQAHELLLDTELRIEPRLSEDGDLGPIAEWGSKLAGAMLRIAGLLHLASEPEAIRTPISRTPISRATLANAIRIGDYFTEHARAAFHLLGDTDTRNAAYLLGHLAKKNIKEFTIRSLHADLPRSRFATADDVTAAVKVLEDHGYVRPQPKPERTGPGRKPSPGYFVHPDLATLSTESTE